MYINPGYLYQNCKKDKKALEILQKVLKISELTHGIEEIFKSILFRALGSVTSH